MSVSNAPARTISVVGAGRAQPPWQAIEGLTIRHHAVIADRADLADTVVVDLDLSKRDSVLALRKLLVRPPASRRLFFVVDRSDHFGITQANALGAQSLLYRPVLASAVRRLLFPADAPPQRPDAALHRAVDAGGAALDGLFASLLSGQAMNVGELHAAASAAQDSLHEYGLDTWLDAVRAHHGSTFQHCLIVTGVAANFARSLGMSQRDRLTLTMAGFLHDIGKIRIPLAILDKPSALSKDEFEQIKSHPVVGYEYLRHEPSVSAAVLDSVRHHHEYLDGTGYPDGLMGGAIGDLTRILTVCDVYGALSEARSYKPPLSPQAAINVLQDMVRTGRLEGALVEALARSVGADPALAA